MMKIKVRRAKKTAAKKSKPVEVKRIAKRTARKFIGRHRQLMGIEGSADQLDLPNTEIDELGFSHLRFRQKHKGLPVVGGEVAVHINSSGQVYLADSKTATDLPAEILPSILQSQAIATAMARADQDAEHAYTMYQRSAQLVILPIGLLLEKAEADTHVAWEVIVGDLPKQERFAMKYYIDAFSGEVIYSMYNIMTLDRRVSDCAAAPNDWTCRLDYASPTYPGYTFGRSESSPARGASPNTGNFSFTALGNNYSYTYNGNTEVDKIFSHLGSIQTLVASSFGIEGANSQSGTGCYPYDQHLTTASVNQDLGGPTGFVCPDSSASFSPSTGNMNFCMRQAVPDIAGHEYGHALLQHLGRFKSGSWSFGPTYDGQSGSLQEAFSDFFGELTEKYITGSNDWRIGTNSFNWYTGQYDGTARYMDAPSASPWAPPDSFSYNCSGNTCYYPYPSRYFSAAHTCANGPNYGDNHGIHRNSTIFSHAIYRAIVGGNEYGCDIQPIGMDAARQIFWRAWRDYFASTETFFQAYNHIQQACADLVQSPEVQLPASYCDQIKRAMQAVQLDYPLCPSPASVEPAPVCAVRHVTSAGTFKPNFVNGLPYPSTRFAPGETMIVKGCNNMPNATVRLSIIPNSFTFFTNNVPQTINANAWANSNYTMVGSTDPNGCFNMTFPNPLSTYQSYSDYYLVIDGGDAVYESYSDMYINIRIALPLGGDGYCQVGQFTSSNEDCANSPIDCGCSGPYTCQSVNQNGVPRNMCVYTSAPTSS